MPSSVGDASLDLGPFLPEYQLHGQLIQGDPRPLMVLLDTLADRTSSPFSWELALLIPADDGQSIAGEVTNQVPLPQCLLSLWGDTPRGLEDVFLEVCEASRGVIDQASACVGVFERFEILPGTGAIRLHYGINRLPAMSVADFRRYWRLKHAEVAKQLIPPYDYVQSHLRQDLTASLASRIGFSQMLLDGTVAIHFPNMAAAQQQISREDVAAIALEDEKHFIDHSRVAFGLYAVQ